MVIASCLLTSSLSILSAAFMISDSVSLAKQNIGSIRKAAWEIDPFNFANLAEPHSSKHQSPQCRATVRLEIAQKNTVGMRHSTHN